MATTHFDETLGGLTNDRQLVAMAVGVIFNRIHSLPKADRDDLFELLIQGRADVKDDEDVESIRLTMLEILTNAPVHSRPMSFPPEDNSPDSAAAKLARHVGETVRRLREEARMSQVDLAGKSGLTQSHVSRIETGAHCPNRKTRLKLAGALGIEARDLDPCAD